MDIDFLACPSCGSEFFSFTENGQRTIFHVSTHYVPIVLAMADGSIAEHVNLDEINCGACSWKGSARQLVGSK